MLYKTVWGLNKLAPHKLKENKTIKNNNGVVDITTHQTVFSARQAPEIASALKQKSAKLLEAVHVECNVWKTKFKKNAWLLNALLG